MALRILKAKGKPLPKEIEEAPELLPGLEIYFDGFFDLCYDRQMGMGFGPIQWMTIETYCNVQGFDPDQKEAFHGHCRAMDAIWLEFQNEKTKNKTEVNK